MKPTAAHSHDALALAQQELEEFAYIVSHDLKAPVRAISNLSVWIEEDLGENLDPDVKQNMDLLRNRASRLERMIEGLLEYSRSTRMNMSVGPTDVQALLQEVAEELPNLIQLQLPEQLPVFSTYKAKLKQVFQAILCNSLMFSPTPAPIVQVQVQEQDDYFLFNLADNSGGMPEEALTKIFTLFYTVSPKDLVDTLGMGLAITKKIVQFAGGSISAHLNEMGGTTICFTWPKKAKTEV